MTNLKPGFPGYKELARPLSKREKEVIEAFKLYSSNKEIADYMCVCVPAIKAHFSQLFLKTGTKTRMQLYRYIIANGL